MEEFEQAMNRILPRIKNKYYADGYTGEDIAQEAYIIGLSLLPKYKPEHGPLFNFLSISVDYRVQNLVRNKNFRAIKLDISSLNEVDEDEIRVNGVTKTEQEFWDIIDEQLPAEFRFDYLKFKEGVYLPKSRRLPLIEELKKIVEPIV
jgi:DNA-directed RNA polymerase specialized sigma24 family protein